MSVNVHVVVRGDSLSRIAQKSGVSLSKIIKLNPSLAKNPNLIRPGISIKLSDRIVSPAIQKIKQKQTKLGVESSKMDLVFPIIFPDYKISVTIPEYKYTGLPGKWDDRIIPAHKERFSNLGHAGVLFINGKTGLTKYYEYGRYDRAALGLVVKMKGLPDAKIKNGKLDYKSLKPVLQKISTKAGHNGRIASVLIEVEEGRFSAMLAYAQRRERQNRNPKRLPYSIMSNSCLHFAVGVMNTAGANPPSVFDPRPVGYLSSLRSGFPDLDYNKKTNTLRIQSGESFFSNGTFTNF